MTTSSTSATIESLLSSAPPGQIDQLAQQLSRITTVSPDLVEKVKTSIAIFPSEISETDELSRGLHQELKVYQQEYYSHVDYKFSMSNDLKLTTHVERIDSKNFVSGSWRGDWQICVMDERSATIQGSIHIHVYYHEDCNVQLESHKAFNNNNALVVTSDTNLAKSIVTQIITFESTVMAEFDDLFLSMDDKLKAIRRVLPVMRTRVEWNVLAHRMVKKLEESSQTCGNAVG